MRYRPAIIAAFLMSASSITTLAVDLLYVSLGNNTIVTYDTTGNDGSGIAATKAVFSSSNLNNPYGLAFDSSGNLYAANFGDSTISKFNASGTYVSNISTNLIHPTGLAFDSLSNFYAANYGNSTISKFSSSGSYLSNISTNLSGPHGLAFDSAGNLYSANENDNTISKFNASGAYVSSIGSSTNLSSPVGLAFDSSGNLFAVNYYGTSSFISKFNASGAYVGTIGSISNASLSWGLAFDSSGNLYVANNNIGSISKFSSSGTFLTSWYTGASSGFLAFQPVTVPEPSTYALSAIATVVITYLAKRHKTRTS
jgi:sugar lactone lactonase YvrE